jgi:phytoene/squalene synthetase
MTDLDWCRTMLPKVSRTFSIGIQMMPEPLEAWITVGYLLCRVIDTVEDTPSINWATRRRLFTGFEDALATGNCTAFESDAHVLPQDDDGELSRGISRILTAMHSFPPPAQQAMRTWVGEMSGGMALYARRHAYGDGHITLRSFADLDRYCYFVAGTVGHFLTDLFLIATPVLHVHSQRLRSHASGFGALLQMTNIIKDVTDDWARGWCFIPETALMEAGTTAEQLTDPPHAQRGVLAVDLVNARARALYAEAIAYILAIPREEEALRRFCLFPMLLAGKTLELARGNGAVVHPNSVVKVSRSIVEETMAQVETLFSDDLGIGALTLAVPGEPT